MKKRRKKFVAYFAVSLCCIVALINGCSSQDKSDLSSQTSLTSTAINLLETTNVPSHMKPSTFSTTTTLVSKESVSQPSRILTETTQPILYESTTTLASETLGYAPTEESDEEIVVPTEPVIQETTTEYTEPEITTSSRLLERLNALPTTYNPYMLSPSSLANDLYIEYYDLFPEYMQIQGDRNPVAREYIVRTLLENPQSLVDSQVYDHAIDAGPYYPYMQWDERWAFNEYSGAYMASDGCGPTALSIVYTGLTGDYSMDPGAMGEWAKAHGYSAYGNGSYRSIMLTGAQELGLQSSELRLDYDTMVESIESGSPLIIVVGPGHFTSGGHFLVLYEMSGTAFRILDPFNYENSLRTWTYDELAPQIENIWKISK